MQLENCVGEKNFSLLERSVNGNVVRFENDKAFSRKNSEFPQAIPKREKSVYKSAVPNFESALDRVVTDRNDFPINGSNLQTRVKSLMGPAVGDGESLRRPSVADGKMALRALISNAETEINL